jgi:urease accessory protein
MLPLLRLQQLADSAFPIGSAAHSFGIEALVEMGMLTVEGLQTFLEDYLDEAGRLEAAYCAASCGCANIDEWLRWNAELGARKPARESRDASAAMGRRFLRLAANISGAGRLIQASDCGAEVHLAACFGFVAGVFGIDPPTAVAAYLQQSMTALVSACQRLLPLGQTQAHQILWNLKPAIVRAAEYAVAASPANVNCFTPLVELASARHATMYTRLFMS